MEESDDIHAALALMYGYAARYAPSTVIEARIDALVVCRPFVCVFDLKISFHLGSVILIGFVVKYALYICWARPQSLSCWGGLSNIMFLLL